MKCELCQARDGKDVNMEDLGAGQFQCPDCRFVVLPASAVVEVTMQSPTTVTTANQPSAIVPPAPAEPPAIPLPSDLPPFAGA